MRLRLFIVTLFAAIVAGCVTLPHIITDQQSSDELLYGDVLIIRPGMKKAEVDKVVFCSCGLPAKYSLTWSVSWWYTEVELGVGTTRQENEDLVTGCSVDCGRIIGPNSKASLSDSALQYLLREGISAWEVEKLIGRPKIGFENKNGPVVLIYPQPGIAVTYKAGRLVKWERTHVYVKTFAIRSEHFTQTACFGVGVGLVDSIQPENGGKKK